MKIPPIDLFSFVLGFLLALILVFIIARIKKLQPQIKKARQERKEKNQLTDAGECERLFRKYMLRKCQRSHLASMLFPLSDVYVDLGLIGHPFYKDPKYLMENEPLLFQHFPIYMGDAEEYAGLPAPLLSLEQALSGGRNVMIMNGIGSGKTTLMAQFASRILEGKSRLEDFNNFLPVFINISDLDYQSETSQNLLDQITAQLHEIEPKINPDILSVILKRSLSGKSLLLLLDGLDELPPDLFHRAVIFIGSICKQYPDLKIVIATGPYYAGDLYKFGFADLSIQVPTPFQRIELVQVWNRAWEKINLPDANQPEMHQLSSLWMMQASRARSILEITQEIWSTLAFDHQSGHGNDLYDYINRVTSELISWFTLQGIAAQIKQQKSAGISRADLTQLIDKDDVTRAFFQRQKDEQASGSTTPNNITVTLSNAGEIVDQLINENFLAEKADGNLTFGNPAVLAYLLGSSPVYQPTIKWKSLLISPMEISILGYSQAEKPYIADWIADEDPYLFRNLLIAYHQIRNDKQPLKYYPLLAKKVLPLVLDESLPSTVRFKLFTIFNLDPQSHNQLVERLKRHPSPTVRQMAALGFGKVKSADTTRSLAELIADHDSAVGMAGCISAFRIFDKECIDILLETLVNGRDVLRNFVAELMAFNPEYGYSILKELAENGNIQSKKAAVYGLRLIGEKWANDLLEKISTSDEQWFVRDAASHALETKWNLSHYVPSRRSEPDQTSWLIKFASQEGQSIPAGAYPYELFYRLIDSGTLEERLVSLSYLFDKPDEYTAETVIQLMKADNPLREEAFSTYEQLFKQTR